MSAPTTPKKQRDYEYASSSPSLIPSPRNTLKSPKYQPRPEDLDDSRIKVLKSVDTNQFINNTKQHHKESHSNHMTHFYHDNIKQLSHLQEALILKKQKLDLVRDEMVSTRSKVEAVELKLDRLREEERVKEQHIILKENELKCSKDDSETKKKFMLQGHELQLQQVRAKKEAELNAMESEYRSKWEKLSFAKLQNYECEKTSLLDSIETLNVSIKGGDEHLKSIYQEATLRHEKTKELWLRNFQEDWKHLTEKKDKITKDLSSLNKHIENNLEKKLGDEKETYISLKNHLDKVLETLELKKVEGSSLLEKIEMYSKDIHQGQKKHKDLREHIEALRLKKEQSKQILNRGEAMRRRLHNELQELRGNIRVYCRIRPPLEFETQDTSSFQIEKFNEEKGHQALNITRKDSRNASYNFYFDKIFSPKDSNNVVFQEVCQLIQCSLDGYNVCIFAYGQTGSGKTYTMLNPSDGMIPLTLTHIFDWTSVLKERGWDHEMECEYIEIYNETILDLFRVHSNHDNNDELPETQKHDIRHNHDKHETYITNVTKVKMTSSRQVDKLLKKASRMRSTASTRSNERSSRSHSVFTIYIAGRNTRTGETTHGKLNLVDLAGSERISSSLVTGHRLRETQNINKSLSCLGDVIFALNSPDAAKRHIPFRNSKLTYLLQYSLIGESKTLMFVNIPPDLKHTNETLNTLRFATKVNSTKISERQQTYKV